MCYLKHQFNFVCEYICGNIQIINYLIIDKHVTHPPKILIFIPRKERHVQNISFATQRTQTTNESIDLYEYYFIITEIPLLVFNLRDASEAQYYPN